MKRSVVNFLLGAIILTAMVAVSCAKQLPALTLDYEKPVEEGAIEMLQGEVIEIPFTVGALEGFAITVDAKCDNEAYAVEAKLNADGATGVITITAPDFIFEDAEIKVTLTVTDAVNSRSVNQVVEVSALTMLENITVGSNCHLTAPDSFIKFPAVKGNSTENLTFNKVELLWEDALGLIDTTFTLGDNAVYVKVAEELKGNAVVCAKNAEDVIVWSWHIWVSEEDATANSMEYTYTNAEGVSTTFHFMDRNLGALTSQPGTADVNGCYYQWGRKDPFPAFTYDGEIKTIYDKDGKVVEVTKGDVAGENNIETAIQNPLVRYWGVSAGNFGWITNDATKVTVATVTDLWGGVSKAKSMYDPCPVGYRMPQSAAYYFLSDANITKEKAFDGEGEENGNQWGKVVKIGDKSYFFPNQGEIDGNGFNNAYGLKSWPCGKQWHSQFDENFDGTNKSYFRAYHTNVSPTTASYSSRVNTAYALSVRCIKE